MRHFISTRYLGKTKQARREQFIRLLAIGLRQSVYLGRGIEPPPLDPGKRVVVASVFEEASTRTRNSSEMAAARLRCYVQHGISIADSSLAKNESLEDTLTMLGQYGVWGVFVRTKTEGAGLWLAQELQRLEGEETWLPRGMSVIIGGEGKKTHATQLLLDGLTILLNELGVRRPDEVGVIEDFLNQPEEVVFQKIGEIFDHLRICFVGDLKYSRVVHSWADLSELFDIEFCFVAPEPFRLESWATPHRSIVEDNLEASLDWPYVYFMRTQIERLTGTPDNPGPMTKREAIRLVKSLEADKHYLDRCKGKLLHAQPRDQDLPMIPNELKNHPKVIMLMQSAIGVPAREAILIECYRGRNEVEDLIPVSSFSFDGTWETKPGESWYDHYDQLRRKNEGRNVIIEPIENGTAVDRLEEHLMQVHDRILAEDGVYGQSEGKQILPGRHLDSPSMGHPKGTLWLYGYRVTTAQALKHGLISPQVRFSHMDKSGQDAGTEPLGYRRVEYPLPEIVEGFRCLNDNCMTRRTNIARPIFRVHGQKGLETEDHYADCGLECISCGDRVNAKEMVEACYGPLILRR